MFIAKKGCICAHSRKVHRNGRGHCMVRDCSCLWAPAPVRAHASEPKPSARATVDESGVLVAFEPPAQPKRSQRSVLEARLWREVELAGLPLPDEVEYRWAKAEGRQYRSDGFYRLPVPTLIEVDGGTWLPTQGRHNHPVGFEADAERANLANLMGYRVLKFTGAMIRDGRAVATLRRALQPAKVLL